MREFGQSQSCRYRSAPRVVLAHDAEKEELRVQMHAFKDMVLEERWERLVVLVVKKLALKLSDLFRLCHAECAGERRCACVEVVRQHLYVA
ncbi:hypothetical protein [Bradyrhizobium iriomotense]|uniref:Uncharacterized protein n=1 Tax=Bradyrhizobium iriomotense TaxID=441950 RepID=A0ABQ6B9M1_9BRAD|nr:hypothetical protein [Bradyrhizobium iriomotense]GLR89635.1 hypothetical protein GCM10007857_63490 [Bradyrhizobium iriomotense]